MPKILLVEDNEMNRNMLSRRLIRNGYEVVMAVDGQQGTEMAISERPDLILMDMSLPVMDGWEATRQVKGNDVTRQIPAIARGRWKWAVTTTTPSQWNCRVCLARLRPCFCPRWPERTTTAPVR